MESRIKGRLSNQRKMMHATLPGYFSSVKPQSHLLFQTLHNQLNIGPRETFLFRVNPALIILKLKWIF